MNLALESGKHLTNPSNLLKSEGLRGKHKVISIIILSIISQTFFFIMSGWGLESGSEWRHNLLCGLQLVLQL